MMTTIDGTLLKEFRADFKNAVLELEQKYNIVIDAGKISYASDSFEMKVKAKITSGDASIDQKCDFEKYCSKYGFSKEYYWVEFELNGGKYKFIGFNPNNRKKVCVIESVKSWERYKCEPVLVFNHVSLQASNKICDCEHCKNAVLKHGAYTGTTYIECGLSPSEEYFLLHPDELKRNATHPDESREKYCKYCQGIPKNGGITYDD